MFPYYGVLSDTQLIRKLGNDIFIWPFKESNLKGATYNLTATKIAFYKNENGGNISVVDEDDVIHFPQGKTVLIQTEESIYISKNYCGTYHTKVSLVSKGLSSISTTLDPCYFGTSLIAINNQSDKTIKLNVGDTFCSLMLYKMKSASKEKHDNLPFRADVAQYSIQEYRQFESLKSKHDNDERYNTALRKIKDDYKNWFKADFRTNREELIAKVKEYKKLRNTKRDNFIKSILLFIFLCLVSYFASEWFSTEPVTKDTWAGKIVTPVSILLFTLINNQIQK